MGIINPPPPLPQKTKNDLTKKEFFAQISILSKCYFL